MSRPIHVLLVEDNPGDADLTKETLEEGKLLLDVAVVRDGAEAIDYVLREGKYADAKAPDLILLDLNIPKRDGREVLAEIRARRELRQIPVVVLTSSDAERDIVQSYSVGANCYVKKPVELAEFQAAIRSIEEFWFTVVKLP